MVLALSKLAFVVAFGVSLLVVSADCAPESGTCNALMPSSAWSGMDADALSLLAVKTNFNKRQAKDFVTNVECTKRAPSNKCPYAPSTSCNEYYVLSEQEMSPSAALMCRFDMQTQSCSANPKMRIQGDTCDQTTGLRSCPIANPLPQACARRSLSSARTQKKLHLILLVQAIQTRWES